MGLLGDMLAELRAIHRLLRTRMAKKRAPRLTPEDEARFEETQRKLRERIAYREAKEREGERNVVRQKLVLPGAVSCVCSGARSSAPRSPSPSRCP
jgi:hypothetical protein